MSQSLCNLLVHCVFHKSQSAPMIKIDDQQLLNKYIIEICEKLKCHCLVANGPGDHEHILVVLSSNVAVAQLVKEVKRVSTTFLKEHDAAYYLGFHWQSGYGAFSVSYKHKDAVFQYIMNQVGHHQKHSSEDEFVALLHSANIQDYTKEFYWSE